MKDSNKKQQIFLLVAFLLMYALMASMCGQKETVIKTIPSAAEVLPQEIDLDKLSDQIDSITGSITVDIDSLVINYNLEGNEQTISQKPPPPAEQDLCNTAIYPKFFVAKEIEGRKKLVEHNISKPVPYATELAIGMVGHGFFGECTAKIWLFADKSHHKKIKPVPNIKDKTKRIHLITSKHRFYQTTDIDFITGQCVKSVTVFVEKGKD